MYGEKRMTLKLLMLLIFIVNSSASAEENQDQSHLGKGREWMKLLHDFKIQQKLFYISEDPSPLTLVEFKKNVEAFQSDPNYSCDFPARSRLLRNFYKSPAVKCPALDKWKKSVTGEKVSLVYVSQYVSNPASAFGHTFLLFHRKGTPFHLNPTISNAAQIPEEISNFEYATKGLFGGFPAQFSEDSFYLKVQEYSNIENREMWVYDLNFSADQIDQLLNHIWELSHRGFQNYRFLNQNCAVNLFNALAAVHPDLEFVSSSFYVLPSTTTKLLSPITTKIDYLPSLREKVLLRSQNLNSDDIKILKSALQNSEELKTSQNPEVADLVLENFELERIHQDGKLSERQQREWQSALLHRASLGTKSTDLNFRRPEAPDQALSPMKFTLGGGNLENKAITSAAFSPFSHSLLEKSAGFLPFSEFVLLETEFQKIAEVSRWNFHLIKMANYPVQTLLDSKWSWRLQMGAGSLNSCESCWSFLGELSTGKTWEFFSTNRFFVMAGGAQDRTIPLSPQISTGGLSAFPFGRMFYQIRALQNLREGKTRGLLESGFNTSITREITAELGTKLEEKESNFHLSLGAHF